MSTFTHSPLPQSHIFPAEIYDLILRILEAEDYSGSDEDEAQPRKTLATCLLVSRSLCHISRCILFKSIGLSSWNLKKRTFKKRVSFLVDIMSPAIGLGILPYIRHLSFHSSLYQWSPPPVIPAEEVLNDESFISMMKLFHGPNSHLEGLTLWTYPKVDWNVLSPGFRQAFRLISHSPLLTNLDISGFYKLPQSFFQGTHVEALRLFHDERSQPLPLWTASSISAEETLLHPYLQSLDTDYSITSDFYPSMPLSRLKTLTSRMEHPERINWTWALLQNCQETLESLELRLRDSWRTPPVCFDFGVLSNLRSLTITHDSILWGPTQRHPELNISQIASLLTFPTPLQCLHLIIIKFSVDIMYAMPDLTFITSLITSANWLLVDAALSHDRFHCVKAVTVTLEIEATAEGGYGALHDNATGLFLKKFPSLSSSKTTKSAFKVEFEVS